MIRFFYKDIVNRTNLRSNRFEGVVRIIPIRVNGPEGWQARGFIVGDKGCNVKRTNAR